MGEASGVRSFPEDRLGDLVVALVNVNLGQRLEPEAADDARRSPISTPEPLRRAAALPPPSAASPSGRRHRPFMHPTRGSGSDRQKTRREARVDVADVAVEPDHQVGPDRGQALPEGLARRRPGASSGRRSAAWKTSARAPAATLAMSSELRQSTMATWSTRLTFSTQDRRTASMR
jgi:hypothetical protein